MQVEGCRRLQLAVTHTEHGVGRTTRGRPQGPQTPGSHGYGPQLLLQALHPREAEHAPSQDVLRIILFLSLEGE